jgi:renalase
MSRATGSDRKRIAVIGSGMSGLTCATELRAAGHEVTVFDKARGPGGRMSTRRQAGATGAHTFDHGAQYFTARDPRFAAAVQAWSKAGVASVWPARFVQVDADCGLRDRGQVERFVGVPTMSAILRWIARDMDVQFETHIHQITRRGNGTFGLVSDSERLSDNHGAGYELVVCAVPAPQIVPLLNGLAPDWLATVARTFMQPCLAFLLEFDEPLPVAFDAAEIKGDPLLAWLAHDGSKPGRGGSNTWVLQATPDWSSPRLRLEPDDAIAKALAALSRLLQVELPAVRWQQRHVWAYARPETRGRRDFLLDTRLGVAACGDWCIGGRIEAAWSSGSALANAILSASQPTGGT